MSFVVTDDKDRVIITVNDKGRVGVSRYPDLNDRYKEYIAEYYEEITGEDSEGVIAFLNYEEPNDIFCA
jgi:hypothetical protein